MEAGANFIRTASDLISQRQFPVIRKARAGFNRVDYWTNWP